MCTWGLSPLLCIVIYVESWRRLEQDHPCASLLYWKCGSDYRGGFSVGRKQGTRESHRSGPVDHFASTVLERITLCVCTSPFCFFCQEGYIVKDKGRCPHFSQCASVFGLGTEMSLGLGL